MRPWLVVLTGWVIAHLLCQSRWTYWLGMLTFLATFLVGPLMFTVILVGWLVFGPKVKVPLDGFLGKDHV